MRTDGGALATDLRLLGRQADTAAEPAAVLLRFLSPQGADPVSPGDLNDLVGLTMGN